MAGRPRSDDTSRWVLIGSQRGGVRALSMYFHAVGDHSWPFHKAFSVLSNLSANLVRVWPRGARSKQVNSSYPERLNFPWRLLSFSAPREAMTVRAPPEDTEGLRSRGPRSPCT